MGVRRLAVLAGLAASLIWPSLVFWGATPAHGATGGRTFYLDPSGDDLADGLTPTSAWRSLDRANRAAFRPGDALLLRGGSVFTGMLEFDARDSRTGMRPLSIGSFGEGPATIAAIDTPAIYVHDTAGIEIHDLVLTGDGNRQTDGITVYNTTGDRLDHVTISRVNVRGFKNGISVGGTEYGFRDVRISQSALHDNMEAGLITYGPEFRGQYANQDVVVRAVEAFANSGDRSNTTRNTGSGIVLGGVDGGRVDLSSAYDNGWDCIAPEGPAGIWAYDSRSVVIEYNVARHNRTGGRADGDGFDLDQNTSSSVLQFNLSENNDGAGFLLYAAREGTTNHGNVIRYNVSRDSHATTDWYGALTVMGNVTAAQVYQNTMTVSSSSDLRPPTVRLDGPLSAVSLRHNRLVSDGAGALVAASGLPERQVVMQDNTYHDDSEWRVEWDDRTYTALEAWRAATGQEAPVHR